MRVATASLVAALTAPVAYVVLRLIERVRSGPIDPLSIVGDPHTAFYWRASSAAWWGGLAGMLVCVWLSRRGGEGGVARSVSRAALPLAVVLAIATWVWP